MGIHRISLKLHGRNHPIFIGHQSLHSLGRALKTAGLEGEPVIVSQSSVWKFWGNRLVSSLKRVGYSPRHYLATQRASSEAMKSPAELLKFLNQLALWEAKSRGMFLVALGGGVVGDFTGFAASIYRRGIRYVQLPTTLTSQVDSSVGGKTALDLAQGKNLVGTIYQPELVWVDTQFLSTLPPRLFVEGLAEVVKYGLIKDRKLLDFVESQATRILQKDTEALLRIVRDSLRIKADVVSRDERDEKNIRIALNFGHTFAHAIENASGYRGYSHGEAVAVGMISALNLSARLKVLKDRALVSRTEKLLSRLRLPIRCRTGISWGRIKRALLQDKKKKSGKLRFVLLEKVGNVRVMSGVSMYEVARSVAGRRRR